MSELPEHWKTGTLRDLARVRNGYAFKSKDFVDEGVPLIRQSNLVGDAVEIEKAKCLPPDFLAEHPRFTVKKGDVLIGMSGSIGKLSWYRHDTPALQNQRTGLLEFEEPDSTGWVCYFLNSVERQLNQTAKGVAVQNISGKEIEALSLPIPPLPEQRRIVARIEDVFSRLDAGVAALRHAKAQLKRYRQSVLAAAVTGELTATWRAKNGAHTSEWISSSIGDISEVKTGKTPKRSNPMFWSNGTIPWLTSSATNAVFTHQAEQFVTQAALDAGLTLFDPGTLLLAMYGEGKTRGQITEITFHSTCNQACAAIVVKDTIAIRPFVRLRLQENYEQTRKAASGGNQPNLNLTKVREIPLQLPPLAEQRRIVAEVEARTTAIDQLAAELDRQITRSTRLRQSTLASAFSGSL